MLLEGPRCRFGSQQKDRYSITSSARDGSDGGTVRPSVLAVLRLNQIEPVNVKRRCQRATTVSAHRDVPFENGGRPRENGHAEVLFSLSNCDQCFRDHIGRLADIAVAHTRVQRLAHLVMRTSRLASHEPDWRRWTVTVTHDPQGPILIIPFGAFGIVPPGGSNLVPQ